jgi:hypothetical protein
LQEKSVASRQIKPFQHGGKEEGEEKQVFNNKLSRTKAIGNEDVLRRSKRW